MPNEKTIESAVVQFAKSQGWECLKLHGGDNTGKPDRVFLKQGRTVFVEFKAPGGQTTRLQDWWLGRLRSQGFEAYVFDNVERAKQALEP